MLNQVYNYIFGNSPSISHTDSMPGTVASKQSKKRGADLATVLAEECDPAPPRKRGRPLGSTKLKKATQLIRQNVARNCKRNTCEDSDSSEREPIVIRTRRNYVKQNNNKTKVEDSNSNDENKTANDSNSGSEYETTDNETTEQPKRTRKLRHSKTESNLNVRRSSRTAVLTATTNQPSLTPRAGSTAQLTSLYRTASDPLGLQSSSAYLSRRSRRSRNVDVTKDLVIMLPGDDPRDMAQLDLRGEVEWEEFLVALAEDTTMMGSDNEDPTAEHAGVLGLTHHHSSTYSVSELALHPQGTSEQPSLLRRRTSSCTSLSRTKEEQQLHYVDVTAGSSVAVAAEVCVPEVKEAEVHRTLSVVNLLLCSAAENGSADRSSGPAAAASLRHKTTTATSSSGVGRARSSSSNDKVNSTSSSSNSAEVTEIIEQIHREKERAGYDHPLHILPEGLRLVNEVYVDYDADSEDERFIEDLQGKLLKFNNTADINTSKAQNKVKKEEHSALVEPELKVRCLELMIARLEREFELARLFSSRASDMRTVLEGKGSAIDESVPYETSKHTFSAPVGGASRAAVVALQTALDSANSSYKLAKRFLIQESSRQNVQENEITNSKLSKTKPKSKQPKEIAGSPETRHQKYSSVNTSKSYRALEKLQSREEEVQALSALAAHSSSANLQSELDHSHPATSSSLCGKQGVQRTPAGRPPLVPRSVAAPAAAGACKPSEVSKRIDQEERSGDGANNYREYYTPEEISEMLPEPRTTQLLQNMLREFCSTTSTQNSDPAAAPDPAVTPTLQTKKGRPRSNSNRSNSCSSETAKILSSSDVSESETAVLTQPESVFGIENEVLIAHEVYEHWRRRRSAVSTSLVRAFHRYIMDLWTRAENVMIPMALDYLPGSAKDIHDRLLKVRFALDRGRTYADRCRRRERLKKDLLRLSSEQLDVLQEELHWLHAPKSASPNHDKLASSTGTTSTTTATAAAIMKTPLASKASATVQNHLSQGRDHRGKFLSSRKSSAKKAVVTPSAAPVSTNSTMKPFAGPNRTGKSVRHHTVSFSIPPDEDETGATEAAPGDCYIDVDEFSSCSSTDTENYAYLSDTSLVHPSHSPPCSPEDSLAGANKSSRRAEVQSAQSTPSSCRSTPSQSKKAAKSSKHRDELLPASGRATVAGSKGVTAAIGGSLGKEDSTSQLRPGSRSRLTSAPDCSLRNLPYTSSSIKKRKL